MGVMGMWEAGEPNADAFKRWVHDAWGMSDRFRPVATTSTSRPPMRARSASGRPTAPTSTASSRIKKVYDPANLFRANRNIRPRP